MNPLCFGVYNYDTYIFNNINWDILVPLKALCCLYYCLKKKKYKLQF